MTAPEDGHDMDTQEAADAVEGAIAVRQGVSTRRSAPMLSEDEAEVSLVQHACCVVLAGCSLLLVGIPAACQLYYVHVITQQAL